MIIWNLLDGGPCHSGPILVREGGSNYSSCHEPTFVQMRVPFGIGDPPPPGWITHHFGVVLFYYR
jgi:hypothetical protein